MNYGFAARIYPDGYGRALDPAQPNKFKRATDVRAPIARALAPLWGGVWNEPQRGNAPAPGKLLDSIQAIVHDRVALLLQPFVAAAQIGNVNIIVSSPSPSRGGVGEGSNRVAATISFVDAGKKQYELKVWVPVSA